MHQYLYEHNHPTDASSRIRIELAIAIYCGVWVGDQANAK